MIGSVGLPELILIFIVALLVFGPEKLPDVAKTIAKTIKGFKKEMASVRKTIEDEIGDITGELEDVKNDIIVAGDLVDDIESEQKDNYKKELNKKTQIPKNDKEGKNSNAEQE